MVSHTHSVSSRIPSNDGVRTNTELLFDRGMQCSCIAVILRANEAGNKNLLAVN